MLSVIKVMVKELLHTENIIALGLVLALLASLFYGSSELSMNIASGLIGYLGRGHIIRRDNDKGGD